MTAVERERRPVGSQAAEALGTATPSNFDKNSAGSGHGTSLVVSLTTYAALRTVPDVDLRPAIGTKVVVERGPRDEDIVGVVVGYDPRGALLECRVFRGVVDTWIPWRQVRSITAVSE